MTSESYRQATRLFDSLRDLPESECRAAVESSCGGDAELREQVMLLLEADRGASRSAYLEGSAMKDAARLLGRNLPQPGALVGKFRLLDRIGSGGMGVIYRAEDPQLRRTVALKILPPDVISGADRIERFEREASAASQLNHPHIISVFDASFDQGCPYIAMELVSGKTLREIITGSNLPDRDTILDILSQVASALSAAHAAGIVHRDIKPENIMVRDDGFVKVLDFGLATLLEPAEGAAATSLFAKRGENLAGTIQYLSPEQMRGEPAEPRSDLFSLGVVAYELATGARPFNRAKAVPAVNDIPAPPASLRPAIGQDLEATILRLIENEPQRRFQTATELRNHCKRLMLQSPPSQPQIARLLRRRWWAAAILAFAACAVPIWLSFTQRRIAPGDHIQITRVGNSGRASGPAISPDGRYLAYLSVAPGDDGIHLMQLATGAAIQTVHTGPGVVSDVSFSPDGAYLYFVRSKAPPGANGLFRTALLGGHEHPVFPGLHRKAAISHNGRFAAVVDNDAQDQTSQSIILLDLSSAKTRVLNRRYGAEYFGPALAWSPDDRYIATGIGSGNPTGLAVTDTRTGELKPIGPQSYNEVRGVAWLADGKHWLALVGGPNGASQIMLVDYPSGRTRQITSGLDSYTALSVSASGDLLATAIDRRNYHIWYAPWNRNALGPLLQIPGPDGIYEAGGGLGWKDNTRVIASTPDTQGWNLQLISTDGKRQPATSGPNYRAEQTVCRDGRTAVYKADLAKQLNLWTTDLLTGKTSRVTSGPSMDSSPYCEADSHGVIFVSNRDKQVALWRVGLDGSAPVRLFPLSSEDYALSPDHTRIASFDRIWYAQAPNLDILDGATGALIRKIKIEIDGRPNGARLRWTPDGSAVLLPWEQNGATNLWLQPADGGAPRQLTPFRSGVIKEFAFSPDGARLAFSHGFETYDLLLFRNFVTR